MRKLGEYLAIAGIALISALPMARGQASATNLLNDLTQETTTNGTYKINQRLENTSEGVFTEFDKAFYKLDLGENLQLNMGTNFVNDLSWNETISSNGLSGLVSSDTNNLSYLHLIDLASFYSYEVPTNSVIGWHFVPATFTANNGDTANLDGGFKVPITPNTTTSNGFNVGTLLEAGYTNYPSTNTMAYFESSSTVDANTNGVPDVADFVVTGSTNGTANLEASLSFTNGNPTVSWEPSISNRVYDVNFKTNLLDSTWMNAGSVTNTGKGENSFTDTNSYDNAFYNVNVSLNE